MDYITPEDVVERWTGDDAPESDDTVLEALTGDANALADWKFPSLAGRVTDNKIPLRIVQMVLAQVVQRAYNSTNNGLSSYSYTSGPFSESGSDGRKSERKGTLYFTQDEVNTLAGSDTSGAFKINLDIHPASPFLLDYPYANYSPYAYVPGEANNGY